MNKVVTLAGTPAPESSDAPDEKIIAFAEKLLVRCKRGEVRALAYVFVRPNGRPSEGTAYGRVPNDIFVLHSGVACLLGNITDDLNASETVEPPEEPA